MAQDVVMGEGRMEAAGEAVGIEGNMARVWAGTGLR
jgi:hypothetical protein